MTKGRRPPIVETASGRVSGRWDDDLAVFYGLPFAASPTGDLRFAAPRRPPGWQGVREASTPAASAPQLHSGAELFMGRVQFSWSEDCLTLNVWSPSVGDERLPVLVWIHGGGYSTGSGGWPWYSGAELSRTGRIVVVAINYRLGALGYLYVPELAGNDLGAANRGLLDQIAALHWVHDNIALFGGDPENVTVAGQSGGGGAVASLMTIPDAKKLFKRGILQSAAFNTPFSTDEAERIGRHYREILGANSLADLREQPVERLLDAQQTLDRLERCFADTTPPFQPVVDENVLAGRFAELLMRGAGAGIDVIIGVNRGEMNIQMPRLRHMPKVLAHAIRNRVKLQRPPKDMFGSKQTTREQIVDRFEPVVGRSSAEFLVDDYSAQLTGASMLRVLRAMLSDEYDYRALRAAADQERYGSAAWFYSFDWAPPGSPLGTCHTLELPFVFKNPSHWKGALMLGGRGSEEIEARAWPMHKAWTSFVATGNPNFDGGVEWPRYEPDRRPIMHFGEKRPTVAEQPLSHGLALWEQRIDQALGKRRSTLRSPPRSVDEGIRQ